MSIDRSVVILKMKQAFKEGVKASRFIADMKTAGLSYRRTDMLADWRNENNLARKKGALQFLRKDYYPVKAAYATVTYKMSAEYMYKVRIYTRQQLELHEDPSFVNIMQDKPMTPAEIEALAWSLIGMQSPKRIGEVASVTAWEAIKRVV